MTPGCSATTPPFTEKDIETLEQQPLAFSTASPELGYVSATSRLAFLVGDDDNNNNNDLTTTTTTTGSSPRTALLNVECFFFSDNDNYHTTPVMLYVHGVCSSCETKGVQHLVREAQSRRLRLAVLELEGHGLSSGARALCVDLDRLIAHVVDVAHQLGRHLEKKNTSTRLCLAGNSLGGLLAAHASERLSSSSSSCSLLAGTCLVAPAVGVHPAAVPAAPLVAALKVLAYAFPAARVFMTPCEDPTDYAAPPTSTRNYRGHWPLGTSKMLLDATTQQQEDLNEDNNDKRRQRRPCYLERVPSLVVFCGEDDEVVPCPAVRKFYDQTKTTTKAWVQVPHGGHDVMYQPSSGKEIARQMFEWMEKLSGE